MADWTRLEVDLIVGDYFSMLSQDLAGQPYNKSQHRRTLAKLLNNRSQGSIEFKHQNITAALINLGLLYIAGYKPRFNYQELLEEAILDYLRLEKPYAENEFREFADKIVTIDAKHVDFKSFIELPPEKQVFSEPTVNYGRKPFKINYLEREQMNASLGANGEQLVIEFERWQLNKAGKTNLADQIRWISKDDDGAGFDILSKHMNGTDKYIEVKTTKLTKEAPFFFSKTEYNFSKANSSNFHLYRIFQFSSSPKMFQATGCFDDFCSKEATEYVGRF